MSKEKSIKVETELSLREIKTLNEMSRDLNRLLTKEEFTDILTVYLRVTHRIMNKHINN